MTAMGGSRLVAVARVILAAAPLALVADSTAVALTLALWAFGALLARTWR